MRNRVHNSVIPCLNIFNYMPKAARALLRFLSLKWAQRGLFPVVVSRTHSNGTLQKIATSTLFPCIIFNTYFKYTYSFYLWNFMDTHKCIYYFTLRLLKIIFQAFSTLSDLIKQGVFYKMWLFIHHILSQKVYINVPYSGWL